MKRTNSCSDRQRVFGVTTDGVGIANHVGTAALREMADVLGLTDALSRGLSGMRRRRGAHDPGRVLCDLAVMIASGGDCVSDLAALRDQPDLFGRVASTATAWRVVDGMEAEQLAMLKLAGSCGLGGWAPRRSRSCSISTRP